MNRFTYLEDRLPQKEQLKAAFERQLEKEYQEDTRALKVLPEYSVRAALKDCGIPNHAHKEVIFELRQAGVLEAVSLLSTPIPTTWYFLKSAEKSYEISNS